MRKVRLNGLYKYSPVGWDVFHPCQGNTLQKGQTVRVIRLPGAPRENTMGQCYVGDPSTGRFICMVSTASLEVIDK
jgi:hypothetical protein